MTNKIKLGTAALLAAGVAIAAPALAATTIVNEASLGAGWTNTSNSTGAIAFTKDFGGAPGFGDGALQLSTPDSAAKAELTTAGGGAPLTGLANASYWTYRDATSTSTSAPAAQTPALKIVIDFNGPDTGGFATLVFEPVYNTAQGTVADGVWQNWSAGSGAIWWSTRSMPGVPDAFTSYVSLSTILAANPAATITAITVGQGSGNAGLLGAVDGLTIGANTFDFQPRVFDKADCKNGGWTTMTDAEGRTFVNQGDCVSYYASNGKTH